MDGDTRYLRAAAMKWVTRIGLPILATDAIAAAIFGWDRLWFHGFIEWPGWLYAIAAGMWIVLSVHAWREP